jgi:KDO2-lipid IV(A) lauroyltransferase
MAEPLRRRLRASALRALARASSGPADPILRAALRAASGLARFSRYERTALANLELALGSAASAAERRRIARGVRAHTARIVGEWLRLARAGESELRRERTRAWIERTVEVDESVARLVREAARSGRGLLVVTGHIGNWELAAAALRALGLDGAVVGRTRRADPTSRWFVEMRAALGVRTLAQDAAPRETLAVLKGGGTLGLLTDLAVPRLSSEVLPFFGRPALTMTAPAALARASGLPLVPLRCVARGARYRLAADEPLELDGGAERKAAALDLLARMNATFERWIRADPEQWAWHQPRWRLPAGADERSLRVPLHGRRRAR